MHEKLILLVEDNPDDEELALRAFRRSSVPCRIEVAHDGQEALDYLSAHQQEGLPHLILLDWKLPKRSGEEVLERIRSTEETKHIPVVVLTTSSESNDIRRSYECGANSYVQKPVNFNEFMETARQLGTYWLAINRHQ